MDGGLAKPADDQDLLMAATLMIDAIDGDEGAVVAVAGATVHHFQSYWHL